jgi:ANTAR domain-containing protein
MSELTGRSKRSANGPPDQPGQRAEAQAAAARTGQPAAEATDLSALAEVSADDAVVRRTKDGWRVGDADVSDLTSAMVLADLISAELAGPEEAAAPAAASATTAAGDTATATAAGADAAVKAKTVAAAARTAATPGAATAQDAGEPAQKGKGKAKGKSGRSKEPALSDTSKLRTTIGQLEHALTARIRVEQAIGVLAERHRIQPRQAFEQLRSAARNRGRRVIDIASDVVASATNPLLQLPDELSRPRTGGRPHRRNRQTPTILGSE